MGRSFSMIVTLFLWAHTHAGNAGGGPILFPAIDARGAWFEAQAE